MFNVVKIGDKEVPMLSLASVDVYYQHIFHEDPLKVQTNATDYSEAIGFYNRMGFVMAKFAELKNRKDMAKLNEDMYLDWLDTFERTDYLAALADIRMVYEGQQTTASDSKKNEEQQNEQ